MEFDFFTFLPLAVAIFVLWKLRSVLGTRNGSERPPFDPYQNRPNDVSDEGPQANDNVVTLPGARGHDARATEDPVAKAIAKIAGKSSSLKQGLTAIAARDQSFDPEQFVSGAKIAYEMIVTGFADGDKRALKGLLSREVYDNFESAIDQRIKEKLRIQSSFVGIEQANIVAAELIKDEAQVTLKFVSQMISATLDDEDAVVEGDLDEVAEIIDVWTFARSVESSDPNWKLVATDE